MSFTGCCQRPTLAAVLDAIASFGPDDGASVTLVAWALDLETTAIWPLWHDAIHQGLIQPAPADPVRHEVMWRLSEPGTESLGRYHANIEALRWAAADAVTDV